MNISKYDITYLSIDSVQEGVGSSQTTRLILGLAEKGKSVCLITFGKMKPSDELVELFHRAGVKWIAKDFGKPGAVGGLKRLNELRRSVPLSEVLHARSDIATVSALLSGVKAPVLWDVKSLWSDQRLLIGTAGWNKITARAARILGNFAASKSVAMTTLTSAVVPILEDRHKRIPFIRGGNTHMCSDIKILPIANAFGTNNLPSLWNLQQ